MVYQPSNSGRSAGITIKDQHSRYFCALGEARSPRTIFFSSSFLDWLLGRQLIMIMSSLEILMKTSILAVCSPSCPRWSSLHQNFQATYRHPNSSNSLEQKCTNRRIFCHFGNRDHKRIFTSPPWWCWWPLMLHNWPHLRICDWLFLPQYSSMCC